MMRVEACFDHAFGFSWNPLRQLGTLAFFFFWIVAITGLYLYIQFETAVSGAYDSVEYMTNQQWYFSGVMRSLHRYASDAMILVAVMHLTREFLRDRYRDVRWYAWFTGVIILWFVYTSGISGYWLVWDQLAQYVAINFMEWLDWLGIFGDSIANNFLTRGSLTDRFFSLLVFIHIFVALILLFLMWVHLLRVSRAKYNPPRGLALGSFLMMLVLSLIWPAYSHPPADLGTFSPELNIDWFYILFSAVNDRWGPGTLWGLSFGITIFMIVLPWIPPLRMPRAASVDLDKCNGCERCFEDCPFGAVTMQARTDGKPFLKEAVVNPKLCTACGICVGACPISTPFRSSDELPTGIDLPDYPLTELRARTRKAIDEAREGAKKSGHASVVVYGCGHGAYADGLKKPGIAVVNISCVSMLPPSFIDFNLKKGGVDGVFITGCRQCDCYHRLGDHWLKERLAGIRDPYLRDRVPRERIRTFWASRIDMVDMAKDLEKFRASLDALNDDGTSPVVGQPVVEQPVGEQNA